MREKQEEAGGGEGRREGWMVLGYLTLSGGIQPVVMYDSYDPDTGTWEDTTGITTVGINYQFDKKAKVQVQYRFIREDGTAVENDQLLALLQVCF